MESKPSEAQPNNDRTNGESQPQPASVERLRCSKCGKSVSTDFPVGTVVRAWIECPECVKAAQTQPTSEERPNEPGPWYREGRWYFAVLSRSRGVLCLHGLCDDGMVNHPLIMSDPSIPKDGWVKATPPLSADEREELVRLRVEISELTGIDRHPDKRGGEWCLGGTRFPLAMLLADIGAGQSIAAIAEDHGYSEDQLRKAVQGAAIVVSEDCLRQEREGEREELERSLIAENAALESQLAAERTKREEAERDLSIARACTPDEFSLVVSSERMAASKSAALTRENAERATGREQG